MLNADKDSPNQITAMVAASVMFEIICLISINLGKNDLVSQKDVGNKVPIYKLKKTDEVMKYYDEWGEGNKYDKDMVDWNYTGPKETTEVYIKYEKNKNSKIYDAGCGTGLVGVELKKHGFSNFYGADLSQKLLDLVPRVFITN